MVTLNLKMQKRASGGLTLIELIVVMAIIGLLAGIAVPALASFGQFGRSDMQRGAQQLHSALSAARIHASTYREDTALVYTLDNFALPPGGLNDIQAPIRDTITTNVVRCITGFATYRKDASGSWVPLEGEDGEFRLFDGRVVIPLFAVVDQKLVPAYTGTESLLVEAQAAGVQAELGFDVITTAVDDPDADPDPQIQFLAHVFNPRGSMNTPKASKQRFQLLVAPSPDGPINDRVVEPEAVAVARDHLLPKSQFLCITVELYQATGKVKVVS